jgi:hypothetical protein
MAWHAELICLVVVREMGVIAEDMFAAGKAHHGVRRPPQRSTWTFAIT